MGSYSHRRLPVGKRIITDHVHPPIPYRGMDWCAYFDGDEPPCKVGWGATEEAAIMELKEKSA